MGKLIGLFVVSVLLTCFYQTDAKRVFVVAPNVFRINVEETVYVLCWQKIDNAEIYLSNNVGRKISMKKESFLPGVPKLLKLKITPGDIPTSWTGYKLYFKINVKFTGFHKTSEVLLDFKESDVFIQTDKPIYTPNQEVRYSIIPVGRDLRPAEGKVSVDIKNPAGNRVKRKVFEDTIKEGIKFDGIRLDEYPIKGLWTITASYGHQKMLNSSVTFMVKEYVLPKFSVKIKAASFVSQKSKAIMFSVDARYVYGKPVKGYLALRLSVVTKDKVIPFYKVNAQINGREEFTTIGVDRITSPKTIPAFPIGSRILIQANVTERVSGDKEQGMDSSMVCVDSPFRISLKRSTLFYKPRLPFDLRFDVLYPNGEPVSALNVKIEASEGTDTITFSGAKSETLVTNGQGEVNFRINTLNNPKGAKILNIKITTMHADEENKIFNVKVRSYSSPGGIYILTTAPEVTPKVGEKANFEVLVPAALNDVNRLNYMFISRGVIVDHGVIQKNVGMITSILVGITAAMAPHCRFLAYYIKGNEVVADSTFFKVEDEFENKVEVEADRGTYRPTEDVLLTVKSDKNSHIGLLAVDKSIYFLRNKSRLLRDKVFKRMDLYDLGCGQGGGANSQNVFEKAGLSVITDEALTTTKREALICPKETILSRRRRDAGSQGISDVVINACCKESKCCNNLKAMKNAANCQKAANLMSDDSKCRAAFLKCCSSKTARGRSNIDDIDVDRFELELGPDDIFEDEEELTVRQYFRETWIWENHKLGNKNQISLGFSMPSALTTWVVSALSINNQTGFGLSRPLELKTSMNFFLRLKMPYSVQRMEQITVYAIIYNYNRGRVRVNVYLKGHSSFCSSAKPGKRSRRVSVLVEGNDAVSIPYTIVPMRIGNSPIEIQAFSGGDNDAVLRHLLVIPEGTPQSVIQPVTLDPEGIMEDKNAANKGSRDKKAKSQQNTLEISVPKEFVQESQKAMVYVTGNAMGPITTALIEGNLDKLIALPTGCGEQSMMKMAPMVYTLRYLEKAKGSLTGKIEETAYKYMSKGYSRVLKYRRNDGSFGVWGERFPGSTWLTAFVIKVFCQARMFLKEDIDEGILCDAISFLDERQQGDGSFVESGKIIHKEMIGGIKGNIDLTAFVLISLLECTKACDDVKERSVKAAIAYLESRVADISTPYDAALVTYALTLAKSGQKAEAMKKLMAYRKAKQVKGQTVYYWQQGGKEVTALNIEISSYALLALLQNDDVDTSGPIANWLTQHRNARGSFFSTQDTVVALQALSAYSIKTAGGKTDLTVDVRSEIDDSVQAKFRIDSDNAMLRQQKEITNAIGGKLYIDTKGTGTAQMQVVTDYNIPVSKEKVCGYDFEVGIKETSDKDNQISDFKRRIKKKSCKALSGRKKKRCKKEKRRLKQQLNKLQSDAKDIKEVVIEVCTRDKRSTSSGMAIIDIGILTGFEPNIAWLDRLINKSRHIQVNNYELNDRHVILHVDKISHTKRSCVEVPMNRKFSVGEVQPVQVKVYDYYNPDHSCAGYYGPTKGSGLLQTICKDGECECGQASCAACDSTLPLKELQKIACLKADFVFHGKVEEINTGPTVKTVTVRIKDIFKMGEVNYERNSKIALSQLKTCYCPRFRKDTEYLFMLRDGLVYVVDDESTIQKWPRSEANKKTWQTSLQSVKDGFLCDDFYNEEDSLFY